MDEAHLPAAALPGFWPDAAYCRELCRPWKLFTFCVAMALLLYGAVVYEISDWDVGITFVMGFLTYLSAPWVMETFVIVLRRRPPDWPMRLSAALFVAWFVVDGSYWLYHTAVGNRMLRWDNFVVSSLIYFMAGLFWLYRGSLRQLLANLGDLTRRH